jgi:hypothetical protein
MKKIYLSGKEKELFVIVDDEDYDKLKNKNLHYYNNTSGVNFTVGRKAFFIHKLILGTGKKDIIKYKNNNKLDNRKENLLVYHGLVIKEKDKVLYLHFNNGIGKTDIKYKQILENYTWFMTKLGYIKCSNYNGKRVFLHTLIVKPRKGFFVDHIDRNPRNNLESNLREVSAQQNKMNSIVSKSNKFGFKGVTLHGGKIIAQIGINRKYRQIGSFNTPEEAALAYNKEAIKLFGEFAYLNEIPNN